MGVIPEKYLTMLRKKLSRKLFLLLILALSLVPVFQAAHMLTHIVPADMIEIIQADGGLHQDEGDADASVDKICLDCLALTALSVIFSSCWFGFLVREDVALWFIGNQGILYLISRSHISPALPRKRNFPHDLYWLTLPGLVNRRFHEAGPFRRLLRSLFIFAVFTLRVRFYLPI